MVSQNLLRKSAAFSREDLVATTTSVRIMLNWNVNYKAHITLCLIFLIGSPLELAQEATLVYL
jgi:hypothetical protein